jgi:hypothetical protein
MWGRAQTLPGHCAALASGVERRTAAPGVSLGRDGKDGKVNLRLPPAADPGLVLCCRQSSSSNALASFRTGVSRPSANQP